jgi:chromosome partitioning protein
MYVPHDTRQLIVDAPAGASKLLLQELLSKANSIVIPVAPSSIDVHATAAFIKELLLSGRIRIRNIRLAVVANRVRRSRNVYEPLERFVQALDMEFLTRLSDSEIYIQAAESGVGIFEMDADLGVREREEFMPIVRWVEHRELFRTHQSSEVVPFRRRHQRVFST